MPPTTFFGNQKQPLKSRSDFFFSKQTPPQKVSLPPRYSWALWWNSLKYCSPTTQRTPLWPQKRSLGGCIVSISWYFLVLRSCLWLYFMLLLIVVVWCYLIVRASIPSVLHFHAHRHMVKAPGNCFFGWASQRGKVWILDPGSANVWPSSLTAWSLLTSKESFIKKKRTNNTKQHHLRLIRDICPMAGIGCVSHLISQQEGHF